MTAPNATADKRHGLGRRPALVGFGVLQVAAITLWPLAWGQGGTLKGLASVALLNVAYASAGTAVYAISMDWSRAGSAGSDYTVQDSLVHLCSRLAGAAALGLAGASVTRACSAVAHPRVDRRGGRGLAVPPTVGPLGAG